MSPSPPSRAAIAATCLVTLGFLAACRPEATDHPDPRRPKNAQIPIPASRPPIDPTRVRKDVEEHADFGVRRRAACPRRIPDRSEERTPFPAIAILEGLGYVTITDDTSRGKYEKVIELNSDGMAALGPHLEEEGERYAITIAEREYLPGREQYSTVSGREDRVFVEVFWRWKPLNVLGERLDLSAPYSDRPEHHGRATYDRTAEGWVLAEVWFDRDHRDYVGGVYR